MATYNHLLKRVSGATLGQLSEWWHGRFPRTQRAIAAPERATLVVRIDGNEELRTSVAIANLPRAGLIVGRLLTEVQNGHSIDVLATTDDGITHILLSRTPDR